jgi:hypothetical protein
MCRPRSQKWPLFLFPFPPSATLCGPIETDHSELTIAQTIAHIEFSLVCTDDLAHKVVDTSDDGAVEVFL